MLTYALVHDSSISADIAMNGGLFDLGKNGCRPRCTLADILLISGLVCRSASARIGAPNVLTFTARKEIVRTVMCMYGESQLFEIIAALHSSCGFACCLYGRQQKGDEHADDGDDDEEFDEGECAAKRAGQR